MIITRLQYEEYSGEEQEWRLATVDFSEINLIVGKNSTGKSRVLGVISGLARLVDGQQKILYDNCAYEVGFSRDQDVFEYLLKIKKGVVIDERLRLNGKELFSRDEQGEGRIWNEKTQEFLEFSIPNDILVLSAKRDRLQHSYIENFHTWAGRVRFYPFGTSLGREQLAQVPEVIALLNGESAMDHSRLFDVYSRGFALWEEDYDKAILKDLELLGYPCTDVGVDQINIKGMKGFQLAAIYVHEVNLKSPTFQTVMSQGMFRALGMVIHLNYACFLGESRTVVIDDIGEGLDFERACLFVNLLIDRCQEHQFQLFMSTNDRFVMNEVDLDHWCILHREGSLVQATTKRNSPELFREFEFLGLNNFDLFSAGIFSAERGLRH
ncbi:AAA family ATPase [Stenotrophomonas rhizophila]|uniref:AAA family ATPase n=1 Tax=Stenotrophomonas rhizophila TaxID=216778 RepID=UPI0028ABDBBB|nr:AAA family ATPase [Stenotrophomonas rhizophila]